MSDPADGEPDPLFALFRQEALAGAAALGEGLAVLAVDPDHPEQFEPLGRAAGQVKAAALIVGADSAADLARGVEDAFAAARRDPATLTPGRVAALLAAADVLKALAEDDPPSSERVGGVLEALRDGGSKNPSPDPSPKRRGEEDNERPVPVVVSPRAVPAEAVAGPGPSAPFDPHAATLLELFREEVRSLCGVLSAGLVELESATADPRRVEPLMRAAHSIKGAARIVGADPAVDLAHAMEDLLVAGQRGRVTLASADVDALLAAVDLLAPLASAEVSAWAADRAPAVAATVAALHARTHGKAAPPPPAPTAPASPPPPAAAPEPPPAPDPPPAREPLAITPRVRPAPPPPPVEPHEPDRVVRISAQSLTRLLSLAGESLVEARWLQPFARNLLKLKKYQDHLANVLEDLCGAVAAGGPTDRPARLAEDARSRIADCRQVLAGRIDEFETHARQSDDLNSRLYREVIASRMRPFGDVTRGFARLARDVARQLGKQVRFELAGEDTDVDRDILDKLEGPLAHILRNALDHGLEAPAERAAVGKPEAGSLKVEARHHAGMLNISVADDGRGIDLGRLRRKVVDRGMTTAEIADRLSDAELLDFLFLPGFSTRDAVTELSGRGVGLDVVQNMAQAVGGTVRIETRPGRGTTFELQLPISLSVVRAVLVRVAGDPYAVPLNRTDRLLRLPQSEVRMLEGKPHFEADGRHVGLVPAHLVFDLPPAEPTTDEVSVVLIGDRAHQYGLIVEGFLGEQDLVVRPLDGRLGKVPNVAAAALLEDGSPVLIVDVDDVARSIGLLVHEGKLRHQRPGKRGAKRRKRVLVVDDSVTVREVERQILRGRGYEVDLAVDGVDGWNAVRAGGYDLVVTDIDMPRMTGLEFVRAIRSDPRVQSTPVVIVSYKDRDDDRARGLDVGADYYLTKSSFHDGRFVQAVEDLIGGPDAD